MGIETLSAPSDEIRKAAEFAIKMHDKQMYGDKPYHTHLADVALTLWCYGFTSKEYQISAWCHDLIEDTPVGVDLLKELFGEEVAEIVFAVTDAPGATRRLRKMATYPKTAKNPKAITLKIADRICNVRFCIKNKDQKMFKTYEKEQKTFEKFLYNGKNIPMWDELHRLFMTVL